ncbi:hypothetical protein BJY01DRAFT_229587 [Aspergillus pseudoustus]|uniref:WSC domain-containing protein n=1 Tax=Aspergillus pseudoustus TaxID=1810923 RepID=A0ABR4IIQ7_9EURO
MRSSSLFSSIISLALSTAASPSFPASSQGCFSKVGTLQNTGSYIFQSVDHCVNECGEAEYQFVGVQGEDCWCGDSLPSLDDLVSDDKCDTACPGYGPDICGGDNAWSIYEIGSIEPSAWLSSRSTSTGGSTSTATESTSNTASDSSATASPTATSTTSTTSPSASHTTSTAPSASPESSSSTVSETPSSTSASIESTPTGNSANRRYSLLF